MDGLEGLLQIRTLRKVTPLMIATALACNNSDGESNNTNRDSSYTTNDTGDTVEQPTHEAPYITSATQATAYVGQEYPYTLTAWQDTTGGTLQCSFNAPLDLQVSNCAFTYTPSSFDMEIGPSYPIDMEVEDNNDDDEATLTLTIAESSGEEVSVRGLSDLSGYTNETLRGTGTYTGDVTSATITLDGTLDAVVRSATVNYSNNDLNYELAFDSSIYWNNYSSGDVSGNATVTVCDYNNDCAADTVSVVGYAATEILITAQTADDKNPLSSATIYVDCNSGESYTLNPNSDGEATAFLNNDDLCMITSDAGSDYAVYSWQHEIDAGSDDEVSSGYYEIWAEVYDNFTPSDLESEYGESSCLGGYVINSRELLFYSNEMKHPVGGDSGRRSLERYSEGQLTTPIQYWASETNIEDGSTTDAELYSDMYDAVSDGLARINNENSLSFTFFEEAGIIDDANYVNYWGMSGNSNTGCNFNADDVIENYGAGYFCSTELRTASERTVMEEAFNTISTDLCGDSISSGGSSFTTIDWFVWNTIHFAKYQNLMERTY